MAKTKVLVLHTAVGYGIKATAENVTEQLEKSGNFEVRIYDIEKIEGGVASSLLRNIYLALLERFSSVWGFLYSSKFILSISLPIRKFLASFKSKHVLQILREFQPAIVISTQTTCSGVMAYLKSKGLYRGKLVIVFSDYHLHEFWLYDEADLYICNIVEQVEQLKRLGVAPERIKLTGTLVAQKFFQPISHEQAVQTLSLLSSMPIVLMGGAGHARSSVKEVFLQLLRSPKSFQIAVVCGNNAQLKEELGKISAPSRHPVKIYGYVDNMEVLMSAASVLVYKTGGPTMAEAVIKKLPMVLTDIHPGHEAWNLQYLIQNGIAKYARIPREVVFMVEQILDGKLAIDHEKNFAQIVRPTGSISIVEAINEINPEPDKKIVKNYQQN